VVDLFTDTGLAASKSEARRLVEQGGAFAGGEAASMRAITGITTVIGTDALDGEGELILRAGKKRYCRVAAH
jgi:tyrosyl-tRNA synthetase